jgi:hypothetical protein
MALGKHLFGSDNSKSKAGIYLVKYHIQTRKHIVVFINFPRGFCGLTGSIREEGEEGKRVGRVF